MNRYCSLVILLLLLTLPTASAYAEDCRSRVSEAWDAPVAEVLLKACESGFSLELLEAKAAEGRAKRVPAGRVAAFLRQRLADYERARTILVGQSLTPSPQVLALSGEALGLGLSPDALRDYFKAFPAQPEGQAALGLDMLTLFEEQGFSRSATMKILKTGFESSMLKDQWRYFPRIVPLAKARGLSDEKVAAVVSQVLADGGSVRDAMAVLGLTTRNVFEDRK